MLYVVIKMGFDVKMFSVVIPFRADDTGLILCICMYVCGKLMIWYLFLVLWDFCVMI